MAHIVGAGDLDQRLTVVAPLHCLALLMKRELWPTPELHAARLGPRAALTGTGTDQITFEFREAPEHGQQEATMRRGRVRPPISQGAEISPLAGDRRQSVEEITG